MRLQNLVEQGYQIFCLNKMTKKYKIQELPNTLPIFPLPGAVLLPQGTLPLNIFEPRYVAMVEKVLGGDRFIGMIQPISSKVKEKDSLYPVGCAGKIMSFTETNDYRYLIELEGVIRFKIKKECNEVNGYRNIIPEWESYANDLEGINDALDISKLLVELKVYFQKTNINVDYDELSKISSQHIIASVPQICSFKENEKQAVLEANTYVDRIKVLISLLKMYSTSNESESIN